MPSVQKSSSNLNLEDIARLTGFSRSTVSRVLNNHPHVSSRTRERVMKVIREYNFQPNPAARALATQRSQVLSVLIPYIVSDLFQDTYFPIILQNITAQANQLDYSVILELTSSATDERTFYDRAFGNRLASGIIIISAIFDDILLGHLAQQDRPCITIGHPPNGLADISFVDATNTEGAYKAVQYLIQKGYKRIGYIPGREGTANTDRREGYYQALREAGHTIQDGFVAPSGNYTETGGYASMRCLLQLKVDAVFCASDMMALGAIRAIKEAGLKIPDNVAVCGFDDIASTSVSDPPLTTVRQHMDQLGLHTAKGLIDILEGRQEAPFQKRLPTELVIRSST